MKPVYSSSTRNPTNYFIRLARSLLMILYKRVIKVMGLQLCSRKSSPNLGIKWITPLIAPGVSTPSLQKCWKTSSHSSLSQSLHLHKTSTMIPSSPGDLLLGSLITTSSNFVAFGIRSKTICSSTFNFLVIRFKTYCLAQHGAPPSYPRHIYLHMPY